MTPGPRKWRASPHSTPEFLPPQRINNRTKSTLSLWKKEAIEILKEEEKKKEIQIQIQSLKGEKKMSHKKSGPALIAEESFRVKRAILDYSFRLLQPPGLLFKDPQWAALPLQSVCLLSGLLTAKMLGATQVWPDPTGLHRFPPYPGVSLVENENG